MKSLAILITCHNRKQKTIECLEALFKQNLQKKIKISVYLVDDGSTDGTSNTIKQNYPEVLVLNGTGNLYWNGGMRLAFSEALKYNYDYYLWLNDDTILYPEALSNLLNTYYQIVEKGYIKSIIVGSTCDPNTGELTYGGAIHNSLWHPLKFQLLKPSQIPLQCDTMCGNCVLIPKKVVKLVGNLDSSFTHSIGDYDYGLRAKQKKCFIWVAPNYIGTCSNNPMNIFNIDTSIKEIIDKTSHPKGLPYKEWKIYAKRHAGIFWYIYTIIPYFRLALKFLIKKIKKNIK